MWDTYDYIKNILLDIERVFPEPSEQISIVSIHHVCDKYSVVGLADVISRSATGLDWPSDVIRRYWEIQNILPQDNTYFKLEITTERFITELLEKYETYGVLHPQLFVISTNNLLMWDNVDNFVICHGIRHTFSDV